jgi:hypothetical protein
MLIDLLYGTTLTCYWSSPWINFSLESRKAYESLLIEQLKSRPNVEDTIESVDWMVDDTAKQKGCLILLRGEAVYRIFCFFSGERVLLLTSCPSTLCAQALDCIALGFDCTVRLLTIPGDALQHMFSAYLRGLLDRNEPIGASQMLFEPREQGPEVTLALPENQLERLRAESESRNEDLIDMVFEHMKATRSISFEKLRLIRVNCSGFTITTNGKMRLYKRMNSNEIERLVGVLLIGSHTLQL